MENPKKNEATAGVFVRYLEKEFGWKYQAFLPEQSNNPFFDVRLDSELHDSLLLQLKQMIVSISRETISSTMEFKVFNINSPEAVVKKAEEKYKEKANNLILILHVDDGYLIESDANLNKSNFVDSTFRGIYMVSPKVNDREEFVAEIKNAFK